MQACMISQPVKSLLNVHLQGEFMRNIKMAEEVREANLCRPRELEIRPLIMLISKEEQHLLFNTALRVKVSWSLHGSPESFPPAQWLTMKLH